MKSCSLALILLMFIGCNEQKRAALGIDKRPTAPISTEFLRSTHVTNVLVKVRADEFTRHPDTLKLLIAQATRVFPEGEYIMHIGLARQIEGYTHHAGMSWDNYRRQIYRKGT